MLAPYDDLNPLEGAAQSKIATLEKNSAQSQAGCPLSLPCNGSHLYTVRAGVSKSSTLLCVGSPLTQFIPTHDDWKALK